MAGMLKRDIKFSYISSCDADQGALLTPSTYLIVDGDPRWPPQAVFFGSLNRPYSITIAIPTKNY